MAMSRHLFISSWGCTVAQSPTKEGWFFMCIAALKKPQKTLFLSVACNILVHELFQGRPPFDSVVPKHGSRWGHFLPIIFVFFSMHDLRGPHKCSCTHKIICAVCMNFTSKENIQKTSILVTTRRFDLLKIYLSQPTCDSLQSVWVGALTSMIPDRARNKKYKRAVSKSSFVVRSTRCCRISSSHSLARSTSARRYVITQWQNCGKYISTPGWELAPKKVWPPWRSLVAPFTVSFISHAWMHLSCNGGKN